jgi:hypothetical protein
MDLNTLIIGLVCLALVIVPLIYFQNIQSKKSLKLYTDFLSTAENQKLDITLTDFWDPFYAIGIDTNNLKLLYIKKHEGIDQQTIVDLTQVSRCSVNKMSRDTDGSKVIDKIELVFSSSDPRYSVKVLEFYSREENLILGHELKICERWCTTINASLAEAATRSPVVC